MSTTTLSVEISDPALLTWVGELQKNNTAQQFNSKIEHILKTYYDLTQRLECSISDNGIDKRIEVMEGKLKDKLDWVEKNFSQKVELFENTMQQSVSIPIQTEFTKLKESIDIFRGNIRGASEKGKMGENLIERIVEDYFPDCEITNTTSQAHQSDYNLFLNGTSILLEVKAYQKNVPTKEVEKFYKDLQGHSNAQAGILISLSSGISKKGKICYEWITDENNNTKLLTFLPNAGMKGDGVIWSILFTLMVMGHVKNINSAHPQKNVDVEKVTEMVKNQMLWIDHITEDMNSIIAESQNTHHNIIKNLQRADHMLVSKWNDNNQRLKKLIETWRSFIEKGECTILPIITNVAQRLACKGCGKQYKVERHYDKHVKACKKGE